MVRKSLNATNANLELLSKVLCKVIWDCTLEKSHTNATTVTMPPFRRDIRGDIWTHTVKKSQTNATNVTMHPFRKAIWGDIWKCTVDKSQTNAMHRLWLCIHSERQFEDTFENPQDVIFCQFCISSQIVAYNQLITGFVHFLSRLWARSDTSIRRISYYFISFWPS